MPIASSRFGVALTPTHKKIALFSVLSFFWVGLPRVVTNATAFALFLEAFGASLLPYTYLGAALAAPAVGAAYLWLQRRTSFWTLILAALAFDIVVLAGVRAGLAFGQAKPFIMAFTIWVEVEWLIAGLVFWGLAERMFNIREAKSLFGVIGAGEPAAVIVGGVLIALLLTLLATADLLYVSILAMMISGAVILTIRRDFAADLHDEREDEEEGAGGLGDYGRYANYVYLIFALTFIAEVAHFFTDNAFYGVAEGVYPKASNLASFIGLFFAASGGVNLVFSVTLSAYLLRRYGVGFSLAVLPLAVGLTTVGALVVSATVGGELAFFALVCAAKLFDEAVRNGIYSAGFLTVFQPLPPSLRTRAHAAAGSYFEQIGAGVAGAALLGLTFVTTFSPVVVLSLLVPITAVWFAIARIQFRRYKTVLGQSFDRRRLDSGIDIEDGATLDAIAGRLHSARAGEVMYALSLLSRSAPQRLVPHITDLMTHADADVRREALGVIAREQFAGARTEVLARLNVETDPGAIGAILRAIGALDGAAAIDTVCPYLQAAEEKVRIGAFVAMMRDMGIEGILEAGPQLLAILRADRPQERTLAVRVLDELASPQFYRLLGDCIRSTDLQVQRLALRTAARVNLPQLRPLLLETLRSPALGNVAVLALARAGEAALGDVMDLDDRGDIDAATRIRLVDLLGRIGGARAGRFLIERLTRGDLALRAATAAAASASGYVPSASECETVWRAIDVAVEDAVRLAARPAAAGPRAALLRSSLDEAAQRTQKRLLDLMALVLPRGPIGAATARLRRGLPEDRAYAVELIDTLLPVERKARLIAAFETSRVPPDAPLVPLAQELIREDGPMTHWLRTVALFALDEADPALAATAALSWCNVTDPRLAEAARRLADGRSIPTSGTAPQSEKRTMLTIEKVIMLRSVSIFEAVPDYLLADVAERLKEVEVEPGETLMREGEMGDRMFVVVDGRFQVSRGGAVLANLGAGDVIGELSLLDPEPRSATVVALESSRLFELGQQDLDDLMGSSSDIAGGFVRMLCRRLRATGARLAETLVDSETVAKGSAAHQLAPQEGE